MTALVAAIIALIGSAAAWLKSHSAQQAARRADRKATTALNGTGDGAGPDGAGPRP